MPISLPAMLGLVLRRSNGNRRLVAAILVGVVLAVTLMASTAIFRGAIDDLGLQFDLAAEPTAELDLRVRTSGSLASAPAAARVQAIIDGRLDRIDPYLSGRTRIMTTRGMSLTPPGGAPLEDSPSPTGHFQFLTDLESHSSIDAGRRPRPAVAASGGAGPEIEVALGTASARALGVEVGDQFDLHAWWRDDKAPVRVTVVGLISPTDYDEAYWRGRRDHFRAESSTAPIYPFFVPEESLSGTVASHLPTIKTVLETLAYIDLDALTPANAEQVSTRIQSSERSIQRQVAETRVETTLPAVLDAFSEKRFFSRVPLLVLTIQIVGIILYYVVMVAGKVVDRQAGEIALLKSRGAGVRQIVGVYVLEGLVFSGVGLLLGPFLALGLIAVLGITPPFEGLSDGSLLRVHLSGEAYLWAGLGAGLALLALVWPAYRASRYSIVQYKQSAARPAERAAFQRYYLDLAVVVVGAILFFQLHDSGSLVTEDLFGGLNHDPLLLMAPAVFILAVAVVFLRLFPAVLAAVSWISDRLAGVAVQLSLWHLVRTPLDHARLVLLLILVTSLGMFAASFGSTLERSFDDRANYEAGAPLRLANVVPAGGLSAGPFREFFLEGPGIADISPALRSTASYSPNPPDRVNSVLLAIEPESLQRIAWFRDDFASSDLATLLAPLAANRVAPPGLTVPADAHRLGLWVRVMANTGGLSLRARLRDSEGRYVDREFTGLGAPEAAVGEWQFLTLSLDRAGPPRQPLERLAAGPLDVVALSVRGTTGLWRRTGEVYWDDLQYSRDADARAGELASGFHDGTVIDGFETLDRWEQIASGSGAAAPDALSLSAVAPHSGRSALRYAWTQTPRSGVSRGIRLIGDNEPLSVLASEDFLSKASLAVGDEAQFITRSGIIPVYIVGSFALFATFNPQEDGGLILANLDRYTFLVNRNPGRTIDSVPNEAWVVPDGAEGLALLRSDIDAGLFGSAQAFDAARLRAEQDEDPLIAAGWEGLLFLSFLAVLILGALGWLVSAFINSQSRALEFAILRTMGFSLRQIFAVVSFEQLLTVLVAMGLGTLIGMRVGILMLDFMAISERGETVTPPLVLVTDWATIGVAYGILGAVFLATIGLVVAVYGRLAMHRVLRLGEQ